MTKAPISLQDLQRRIDGQAQAAPSWRCWGLEVPVGPRETLREAYRVAQANNGAPGMDGVTCEDLEASGVEPFRAHRQEALVPRTSPPMRVRRKERPKDGGTQVRVLGLPTMRDRGGQGALQVSLAPIGEADVQPGSSGYRPQRSAHAAGERVAEAMASGKTRVLDVDLQAYGDHVRHPVCLAHVAKRINEADVMHLGPGILKASGSQGVPQGGVSSPWRSHLYLTEGDRMLERAKDVSRSGTDP